MKRHAGYLIAGALVALGALTLTDKAEPASISPPRFEPTATTATIVNHRGSTSTTVNHAQPRSTTPNHREPTPPTVAHAEPTPTTTPTPAHDDSTPTSAKLAAVEPSPCAEWLSLAASVGWPAEMLDRVGYIIHRESRCDPAAYNAVDPNGGSRGLMQINGFWCRGTAGWPAGFVQTEAGLDACDDLFDPEANLAAALAIYRHADQRGCGWSPWATRRTRWCS